MQQLKDEVPEMALAKIYPYDFFILARLYRYPCVTMNATLRNYLLVLYNASLCRHSSLLSLDFPGMALNDIDNPLCPQFSAEGRVLFCASNSYYCGGSVSRLRDAESCLECSLSCVPHQSQPDANSFFFSIVLSMKLLNAVHLFAVGAAGAALPISVSSCCSSFGACELPAAMRARFFSKRSRSMRSSFSFFLSAPGLLFRLLCLIFAWPSSTAPSSPSASAPSSSVSGSASARDSNVVTSFLFGRRRFLVAADLVTLDISNECFISRLSFFVKRNEENGVSTAGPLAAASSEKLTLEPATGLDALARNEVRLPLVGACKFREHAPEFRRTKISYHVVVGFAGVGAGLEEVFLSPGEAQAINVTKTPRRRRPTQVPASTPTQIQPIFSTTSSVLLSCITETVRFGVC